MRLILKSMVLLYVLSVLNGQSNEVSYVRYFEDDHNFISNLSMMATNRRGIKHLVVSYNEKNYPVKIERILANGSLEKREMLKYDESGKLIERGEYSENWYYLKLTIIGDSEPWAQEFRAWRYAKNEPLTFTDQRTYFTIQDGQQVSKVEFETIDGQKYGQIELDYDYLGNLHEERWRDLPSARIIRRFKYKFDIMAEVTQIWEFGLDGELLSHVAINQAPADQLYKTPPPRSHNTLDEVDIIAKEIKASRIIVPFAGIIPKTIFDELITVKGDRIMIDFVDLTDSGIKFRMDGEMDVMTIPFYRVRTLTSRMGDVIYPKPIHIKTQ
ncbi:MAG: hypothetical protein HOB40_06860 [Candidatus Marinimicrobia bacterium]|jgi:uncharacterized protein YkuJ|nr:hypothetical protein [Candidatus Neomarinimicrobiota bacterium]MBT3502757.1 hypothetical protein [Candidatus Neomarinimicrobiota bacterium]MBT3838359.1 hypothetical protein [Candidatus Neomarinimicrobiota bacterium]MBT4000115.1 hypothetical protein [Candidatus Neomarinimicrobiota bacterium]MBT4283118.1 hypothetical protein [Candidatus Neomarinimicrobiota bacterium]